jgi:hypothetical protein
MLLVNGVNNPMVNPCQFPDRDGENYDKNSGGGGKCKIHNDL